MTRSLLITAILLCGLYQPLIADTKGTDNTLPKVLIIGDSISMGYTRHVKDALKGRADVQRHKGNAGPTIRGLDKIDEWLGDTEWDIIHFNWGLWDIYGWEYAKDDRSPAMYEKRLKTLVARLKKTKAVLIWGTTTPVCPAAESTMLKRFNTSVVISPEQEKVYLDAAQRVMSRHKIEINDLHGTIKPFLKEYAIAANDVHFTKEGSKVLAKQVAAAIARHVPDVAQSNP